MKENEKEMRRVEACLFLAARYLSIDELVRFTGISPLMLRELIKRLKEEYDSRESSIVILERKMDGKELWKMDVKQEFSFLVNKLASGESEFTGAEQETLAIIAYKQPIKQSVVVKIRGNKAYEHIKHFISAGLIRAKKLGRTLELNTSEKFYDYFNIKRGNKNVDNS